MIISHSKGVCFWKIARTGSSTVELLLRLTAGLDLAQDVVAGSHFYPSSANMGAVPDNGNVPGNMRAHMTPTTAIAAGALTPAQYAAYDHYCIIRDPVERFLSAARLGFPRVKLVNSMANVVTSVLTPGANTALLRPQVQYLLEGGMNALPFSDYVNSVATILAAFGAPALADLPNIVRYNPNWEDFMQQVLTPADVTALEGFYSADTVLST